MSAVPLGTPPVAPHPAPTNGAASAVAGCLTAAAAVATLAYLAAAIRLRRRGDLWPRHRDACGVAGGAALTVTALAVDPHAGFTAHMAHHLVLAMLAPLLWALARPVTLALRVLPPGPARRGLVAVAHCRPVGWLLWPPTAALLDVGGLWLLYRTGLLASTHQRPVVHALVHLHLLLAGGLFTGAVCRLDPSRHRCGLPLRGGTLLVAGAAHAVLARTLYATPPPGTAYPVADLRAGAQLMYYGGDLVELALAGVLAAQWYTATGRARRRRARRAAGAAATAAGRPRWSA